MAKVCRPPEGFDPPEPDYKNYDFDKEQKLEEEYLKRLSTWCKEHGSGELAGETIRSGVADGYALYMVVTERPLQLIHITLGDAYSMGPVWERGLRISDVRQMVEREKGLAELFRQRSHD